MKFVIRSFNEFSYLKSCCEVLPDLCKAGEGLKGRVDIPVSVTGLPPHVIWADKGDRVVVGGADYDIAHILAEKLGFTFNFIPQQVWGAKIENSNEWSGAIGTVKNETSLLAYGHIIIQTERFQVVDYVLLYPLDYHLISPKAKKVKHMLTTASKTAQSTLPFKICISC